MDQLEVMRILLLSVDKGSFSAAGRALGMPLATVSRKVAELEAHLGARLLHRTTRKLVLTEAGAVYLSSARRILDQVSEAERVAAEFLAAFPKIDVRLRFSDRNLDLIDEHVDMAVRIGSLPDSSMVATRIGSMRTVVCASPELLLEHGEPGVPDSLATLPSISYGAFTSASSWPFRHAGTRIEHVAVRSRLSVSTAEAAVWAAIRGVGVTRVLHYQCADALRAGLLQLVLTAFEPEPLPVHLIHASRDNLPLKLRAFLDFAAVRLRDTLKSL